MTRRPAKRPRSWCFEDKKKPPSKAFSRVREAPVDLVAGKIHKEIRETEQDNVGVESAHKSEEAVETGAYLVREGYRSHKLKPYRKAATGGAEAGKGKCKCPVPEVLAGKSSVCQQSLFPAGSRKQAIKKQYAAAKRAGQTAGNTAQAASPKPERPQGR